MARKSPKSRKKKQKPREKKSFSRNLVSSYESWLSKEGKASHHSVSKRVSSNVPIDTFHEWMKMQPVKEGVASSGIVSVSSTYDDWIVKMVAERQSRTEDQVGRIQTLQSVRTEIAVKPTSSLANTERSKEEDPT